MVSKIACLLALLLLTACATSGADKSAGVAVTETGAFVSGAAGGLVTAGAQEEITIATAKLIVEKTKRSFIFFILLMLSIMK